jgi:DNA mismatch repair protein MutS
LRQWDDLDDCAALLTRALVDEPPVLITEGGLFRSGYDPDLDELLDLVEHGEGKLQELLKEEQSLARLPKLRLGYNRVFGHYFELSKAAGDAAPAHFIRRQTVANAERFTTPALSELEDKLISATDRRKQVEYKLFQELREAVASRRERIVFMASLLAHLDYWQSLAETAARWGWNRPELREDDGISIVEGRHPVVEAVQGKATFVPNDLRMDGERRLILITGPNMAGKSTVLRQTAIICILAQMGSFVPAKTAVLGLCDRIFSRVGASDNLARGQSTFMVEMMETARILRQATRKSLVILDEIGRGTSTFDGLALARAVVEDLVKRAGGGIRTLFATHYHELTALEGVLPGLHNMNIAVQEWNNEIVFLRRLVPGPTDRSYGIEVARLAGVPHSVVQRAREILRQLERPGQPAAPPRPALLPGFARPEPAEPSNRATPAAPQPAPKQPAHPLLTTLRDLDPDGITPMEALKLVCEWKMLWGNDREA